MRLDTQLYVRTTNRIKQQLPIFRFFLHATPYIQLVKQIRAQEQLIPAGLRKDWDIIQDIVRAAKRREEFDYSRFNTINL
ncbi:hypothetical protein BDD39_001161 [Saccharococcus thermophilus]|uniref:Uncharacterized protein n=1 Tax=Saccharococcus thermophilus TaxID=29396 RepID=A0A846MCD4_9BACL|nr:hypothetical protein [Saccharococcus thermophilus]